MPKDNRGVVPSPNPKQSEMQNALRTSLGGDLKNGQLDVFDTQFEENRKPSFQFNMRKVEDASLYQKSTSVKQEGEVPDSLKQKMKSLFGPDPLNKLAREQSQDPNLADNQSTVSAQTEQKPKHSSPIKHANDKIDVSLDEQSTSLP